MGEWLQRLACVLLAVALVGAGAGCTSKKPQDAVGSTTTDRIVTTGASAIISGTAVVDGVSFSSQFTGAVVLRSGLATPCQDTLPPIDDGKYAVVVLADADASGCGAPDATIVLWTFAAKRILFSTNTVPWPENGGDTTFEAQFSTAAPAGAAPVAAMFQGAVLGHDGRRLPVKTRVEAYVGSTRCAVASVRDTESFKGYVMSVVGPDSIPGCALGAPLTFRIAGRPAMPTNVVNTPPGQRESLDLQLAA